MRTLPMRPFCLCLLTAAACLPAPHSLVGAACDPASDPCPSPLFCVAKQCSESVPPDETLLDDDFETSIAGWNAIATTRLSRGTVVKHGGTASFKLAAAEGAAPPFGAVSQTGRFTVKSGLYCASLFALHGTANGRITLEVRSTGATGAVVDKAVAGFDVPTPKAWQQMKAQLEVDLAAVSAVSLVVSCDTSIANADINVDDVKLVRTYGGSCP